MIVVVAKLHGGGKEPGGKFDVFIIDVWDGGGVVIYRGKDPDIGVVDGTKSGEELDIILVEVLLAQVLK